MSESKVKIISGWSNQGGSTSHHIFLTNLLNENGFDCTFYGAQKWHLDKCQSGALANLEINVSDIVISHFLHIKSVVKPLKHILSCHETNLFPLKKINLHNYDLIHFVSNSQRNWHSVHCPYVIIPPLVPEVKWEKPCNNFAGVVGIINSHKQTHKSIERALSDGFEKVLLFGLVTELDYFNQKIGHFIENGQAIMMGYENDREKMYNEVDAVYHASIRETYGLVEAECRVAGIPFNGPSNELEILSKEDILARWQETLLK